MTRGERSGRAPLSRKRQTPADAACGLAGPSRNFRRADDPSAACAALCPRRRRSRMHRRHFTSPAQGPPVNRCRHHRLLAVLLLGACSLLSLPTQGRPAKAGKKYALLVGVCEYEHARLSDLQFAENDVAELAKLLRPAGFDVSLLTDS